MNSKVPQFPAGGETLRATKGFTIANLIMKIMGFVSILNKKSFIFAFK
jgi:hypothetical protein